MERKWTDDQQNAISLRDRNLLVSAAAGAGKTAALVERIITMLTKDTPPLGVDQLLVVTFTNAAAAEMKERILDAIEQQLELSPQDAHLSMQATLINTASICTIDSFCESVIRDHFHVIDLDPGFRVGEENEISLLKHEVMEELLEEKFQEQDPQFLHFVDAYSDKYGTDEIESMILTVYDTSRQDPDPDLWLDTCLGDYQAGSVEEMGNTGCGKRIREQVEETMRICEEEINEGRQISQSEQGPAKFEAIFDNDRKILERMKSARTPDEFYQIINKPGWMNNNTARKGIDPKKLEKVKELRGDIRNRFNNLLPYFEEPAEEYLKEMQMVFPDMEELILLVKEFDRQFQSKKREQNLIDFADMEAYALQILTEEKQPGVFTPSPAAREYQDQFEEVMVDEYQDVNLLQETILTSVSRMDRGENNLFMVGDVKQSIYGFRSSRPKLFLEKYETYTKTESLNQRIDLQQNFRSRTQVVDSVNVLFRQMMRRDLGGVEYDEDAALHAAAEYETPPGAQKEYETEILLLDGNKNAEREARVIAGKIHILMGTMQIQDVQTKELRPLRYGDIAVLLRGIGELSGQIEKVFAEEGIPVVAETKAGYFSAREVQVILSYLQVLDNAQQDIPLTAVLTSPLGGLSEEDLAKIRTAGSEQTSFHAAVEQYRSEGEDERICEKLRKCLGQMDRFREQLPYTPIHELLWKILDETGYGDFVAAMPDGEQRKANLDLLVDLARSFEAASYKGLFHFVRYIEKIQDGKMDLGEADLLDEHADAVRVMTIHKSKGLEFPVVFLAGLGKQLRIGESRKETAVIVKNEYGIGLEVRDLARRVKTPGLVRQWVRKEQERDEKGEELRLLYVACTRAREKLVLVGNLKNAEKSLPRLSGELTFEKRQKASTRLHWILPAFLNSQGAPLSLEIYPEDEPIPGQVKAAAVRQTDRAVLENWDTDCTYDPAVKVQLDEQFSYVYPYEDAKNQKLKFTVSELKKRTHMEEMEEDISPEEELGEEMYEEPDVVPLIPKFMQKEQETLTGADRGTAYHRVLELLDVTRTYDEASLSEAVQALARAGKISRDMADCIRTEDLLYFLNTGSGVRMRKAARRGTLHREQPFVLGVDTRSLYPGLSAGEDEITLIQGIIDVYFEEEEGLVVLDYKTDNVTAAGELKDRYHAQVEYYAQALEQMLEKPVKEKIIYSFTLRQEIRL